MSVNMDLLSSSKPRFAVWTGMAALAVGLVACGRTQFNPNEEAAASAFPNSAPIQTVSPARADDGDRVFTFVSFSQAATTGGVQHRIAMQGSGTFNAEDGEVAGGGNFVHFNNAAPGVPKPILASGTWKAKEFVSYRNGFGITYGHIEAGILVMKIDLTLDGTGEVVRGVTLRLICNIGAAGVTTGEAEGYVLTMPSGTFRPLDPVIGLTHLSSVSKENERENEHRGRRDRD